MVKKVSMQDKLDKLKDKLAKMNLGGSSGYFSVKVGESIVRILPEVGDMEFFFQQVGRHYLPGREKNPVYCPDFISDGEHPCPICELVDELRKGDKTSKAMADKIAVERKYWMNILSRDDPSKPLILTAGYTIFTGITQLVRDPEYGAIYDLYDGLDITIERKGTGMDTEYDVRPRRRSTPLIFDPKTYEPMDEEIEDFLAKARDLSWVMVDEDPENDKDLIGDHAIFVLPYERIRDELGLDDIDFTAMAEEEEEAPVNNAKPKARRPAPEPEEVETVKPKRRPVQVVEEEDDAVAAEDEDEEEEDEARAELERRRKARTSLRRQSR